MKTDPEVLRLLAHIDGELVELRKLSERVRRLEVWQSWIRGGWAAVVLMYVVFGR